MRKTALAILGIVAAAGLAGAVGLVNGYGSRVTITQAAVTRVTFPGPAQSVSLANGSGGRVYYGFNCSTAEWSTIYAATNGMILEASASATLYPESGPYFSICLQGIASTSIVNVVAQ